MGECQLLLTTLSYLFIYFCSWQLVKQAILPRVHGLALKTTVAAVCMFLCYWCHSYLDSIALIIYWILSKDVLNYL